MYYSVFLYFVMLNRLLKHYSIRIAKNILNTVFNQINMKRKNKNLIIK